LESNLNANDILLFHGASAGAISRRLARKHKIISNPHGMEEFKFSLLRTSTRFFLSKLTRKSKFGDAVIATDLRLVPEVLRHIGCTQSQVQLIPNSVNIEYLDTCARSGTFQRASTKTVLTSVGRLAHNKGYDLLLKALIQLDDSGKLPKISIWFHFGSGSESRKIHALFSRRPRGFEFDMLPGQSDEVVQSALEKSRVFVQPSRYEGSSLTTLEAMCRNTVVVGTPVGGIPDKITDTVNGFLSKEASAQSLALAILRALESNKSEIARQARATVETNFSIEATGDLYVQLFKSL